MDINIRDSIKRNFRGTTSNDIRKSIDEAVSKEVEQALPGLGVLFEIIWKNSDETQKNKMLSLIKI